jgi:hypothetical protein
MTLRPTLKRLVVLAAGVGMLAFAAVALADYSGNYFDPSSPPANHHVHDCTLVPRSAKTRTSESDSSHLSSASRSRTICRILPSATTRPTSLCSLRMM